MVLAILLLFSVASWAIVLYKAWAFRRIERQTATFLDVFRRSTKFSEVQAVCKSLEGSPLVGMFQAGYAELNLQLRPTILAMKPGTRVVSHSFLMDDWRPDERSSNEDGQAYMWIVPANVAGTWRFEPKRADGEAFTLDLDQTFQEVRGSNKNIAVTGRLSGDQLQLTFAPDAPISSLHGRIDKNTMDARVIRGGKALEYVGKRS